MGLLAQQFRHKRVPHYYDVIAPRVRIWAPWIGGSAHLRAEPVCSQVRTVHTGEVARPVRVGEDDIKGAAGGAGSDLMMDPRTFLSTIASGLLAAPLAGEAQQAGKMPRIGSWFLFGTDRLRTAGDRLYRHPQIRGKTIRVLKAGDGLRFAWLTRRKVLCGVGVLIAMIDIDKLQHAGEAPSPARETRVR
jgi:hypothetical protein